MGAKKFEASSEITGDLATRRWRACEPPTEGRDKIAKWKKAMTFTPDLDERGAILNLLGNATRLRAFYVLDQLTECAVLRSSAATRSAVSRNRAKVVERAPLGCAAGGSREGLSDWLAMEVMLLWVGRARRMAPAAVRNAVDCATEVGKRDGFACATPAAGGRAEFGWLAAGRGAGELLPLQQPQQRRRRGVALSSDVEHADRRGRHGRS